MTVPSQFRFCHLSVCSVVSPGIFFLQFWRKQLFSSEDTGEVMLKIKRSFQKEMFPASSEGFCISVPFLPHICSPKKSVELSNTNKLKSKKSWVGFRHACEKKTLRSRFRDDDHEYFLWLTHDQWGGICRHYRKASAFSFCSQKRIIPAVWGSHAFKRSVKEQQFRAEWAFWNLIFVSFFPSTK